MGAREDAGATVGAEGESTAVEGLVVIPAIVVDHVRRGEAADARRSKAEIGLEPRTRDMKQKLALNLAPRIIRA